MFYKQTTKYIIALSALCILDANSAESFDNTQTESANVVFQQSSSPLSLTITPYEGLTAGKRADYYPVADFTVGSVNPGVKFGVRWSENFPGQSADLLVATVQGKNDPTHIQKFVFRTPTNFSGYATEDMSQIYFFPSGMNNVQQWSAQISADNNSDTKADVYPLSVDAAVYHP
ncbi:hypothetical protein DFO55_11876 [Grimontella sp. AG753]|nr:hypothetical protein DFO55_11876 [Grimontella sp. AG753]